MAAISGGDKLAARLAELAKKVDRPATLSVGFLEGTSYPDGKPVAMIAAIQEFGAPARNIPPRPFFRQTIASNSDNWPDFVEGLLFSTNYDPTKTLLKTGEEIKGELQDSIIGFSDPPNAPSTIAKKGFDDPLISSGFMLQSINYKVE